MSDYFLAVPIAQQKKEKEKARTLRASSWWKNQLGKGLCYHCQGRFPPSELSMDHLIPIVRGGKSDRKNCVASCKKCNTRKGHQTTFEMSLQELKKNSLGSEGESES